MLTRVFPLTVLLIVVMCLLRLPALAATDAADRAALLDGVHEIVVPGGIPGDVSVFGAQAFAVLAGRMGEASLPVFAAARYGRGRVVVGGHEGFFGRDALKNADNVTFAANISHWAGAKPLPGLRVALTGQDAALASVLRADGCRVTELTAEQLLGSLRAIDVLWLNQASLDGTTNRARVAAVQRWVQGGGALVVTGPGWGWQQVNSAQDLSRDQSANQIVVPMGLAFGSGMLDGTDRKPISPDPGALALVGANEALAALEAQAAGLRTLSSVELSQTTAVLGQAVSALPPEGNDFARQVATLCRDKGSAVPTRETPITPAMPFARLKAVLDFQEWKRLPAVQVRADPSAASFPGAVPADAPRETRTITVNTGVPQWHGTGLYAAPGEVVTITLPASAANKGLSIRIGSHTDALWRLDKWERFPEITMSRPLDAPTVHVAESVRRRALRGCAGAQRIRGCACDHRPRRRRAALRAWCDQPCGVEAVRSATPRLRGPSWKADWLSFPCRPPPCAASTTRKR